ncbi:MAG: aminobenzoate synthetase, partial [Pelagibacteraceae bacterium BACL5 MAG-120813-bin20]
LTNNLNFDLSTKNKVNHNFKINIDKKSYTKIFDQFKKKIKAGETYQIKICTKYVNKSKIDPLDFFCRLSKTNLAPEAFMIKDEDYSIISCSPENLITKKGYNISTKPIAGTLKKNKSLNKKKALSYFQNNIKESKEHNMIVDMERSDLSKICEPGSVKILKLKEVEEYKDLYHYVSLIGGKLKKGIKNLDIIKSMMPGGSVIGCPKISTLQFLNNQEKENRNIYTGSFGYIKFNGDMRFNIIIRSLLNFKNISEIAVASGVVIDSNANHEFNENYIKAKALIDLFK